MIRELFPAPSNVCVELGPTTRSRPATSTRTHIRPGGFISGPTQFALVDSALWFLTFVALGRIEPMAMTSELSIRYLRPAQGSRCTAAPDSRRSAGAAWSAPPTCGATTATDKITATAQGTYAIPLPR